jgi:perosamine synthetase
MAKVMTCVEGGMVFTCDAKVAEELRIRRNQGESEKYLHSHLGTNARMIDMCAAIGLEQFKKLPWMLKERRRVAERYNAHFSRSTKITVMKCVRPDSSNAYFFYPILIKERDHLISVLKDNGIDTRVAYPMPVYQQQMYQCGKLPYRKTLCPIAEQFTASVVNLPIFPGLKDAEIDEIAEKVLSIVK